MQLALAEAAKGGSATWKNPQVGAVIVKDGQLLATGYHHQYGQAHAERDAISKLSNEQLAGATIYVTLEPCPMCAGGIINARVDTVRYGTRDDKAGACGSVLNLFEERFNHHPRLYRGPLERECQEILQDFFQGLREDGAGENG